MLNVLIGIGVAVLTLLIGLLLKMHTNWFEYKSFKPNPLYDEMGRYGEIRKDIDRRLHDRGGSGLAVFKLTRFVLSIVCVLSIYFFIYLTQGLSYDESSTLGILLSIPFGLIVNSMCKHLDLYLMKKQLSDWESLHPEKAREYRTQLEIRTEE